MEREIYFFVYREIPIDEKNLSNQFHDKAFFMARFLKTWGQEGYLPMMLNMQRS